MINIKFVKSISSKNTFSINSILCNCKDVFNVSSIFFHYVIDMKIMKDISSRDTFSINLILWYCENDIFLVQIQFYLTCMANKKI